MFLCHLCVVVGALYFLFPIAWGAAAISPLGHYVTPKSNVRREPGATQKLESAEAQKLEYTGKLKYDVTNASLGFSCPLHIFLARCILPLV